MDFFDLDNLDLINLEIYKEFNTKNLTISQALKQYSNNFGKTALYLISKEDYKKTGILSIFLLSHLSIELYLKSLFETEVEKKVAIHDLEKILYSLPSNKKLNKDIKNKILAINKIGINSFGFRYPIDKNNKKYKNFKIELLPELNYLKTTGKGSAKIARGIKQSPVKNYIELISDIKFVLKSLLS